MPLLCCFFLCVVEIDQNKENIDIKSEGLKISEINKTIIVIIAIYSTYILKWRNTLTNNYPIPL